MQRPVMNPQFYDDDAFAGDSASRRSRTRRLAVLIARLLMRLARLLLARPFSKRSRQFDDAASPFQSALRGMVHRLALAPMLLVLMVAALVYAGTHPPRAEVFADPATEGIYYDPVTFLSEDQTRLEAWLVPVLDAQRINADKEKALKQKQAAVVLIHDYGATRASLLPLVKPLHEAGMVVLSVGLRGCGTSGSAGLTFGINESQDVTAAVEMLRRRQFIDAGRIGVVGVGTGATAALLAAQRDPQIAAIVIEDPPDGPDDAIARRIGPQQRWLAWMHPLCKWTFEIAYHADTDELKFSRFRELMKTRAVFMVDGDSSSSACVRPATVKQIEYFLTRQLHVSDESPLAGSTL